MTSLELSSVRGAEPLAAAVAGAGLRERAPVRTNDAVRRRNLGEVLTVLRADGACSRAELTATLAVNRSTMGALVADLVDRGLVTEGAPAHHGGPGRPSPVVHLAGRRVVALAVEIEVEHVALALVALDGEVLARRSVPRRAGASAGRTAQQVAELAEPLLAESTPPALLAGMGIAVAGVVRPGDGAVRFAPNLGWRDVPLQQLLVDALGERLGPHPTVMVGNDANLGALVEAARGAGRGADPLVYLSSEIGVGGGVVLAGRLLEGAQGCLGEVGHLVVNPDGLRCRCGSTGCWETEVGENALLRRAGLPEQGGGRAVASVLARAAANEPAATTALLAVGRWVGVGLGNIVNAYGPRRIVLGGFLERVWPLLEPVVRDYLRGAALTPDARDVEVVGSCFGADSTLLGAAEVVFSAVLDDPTRVPSLSG